MEKYLIFAYTKSLSGGHTGCVREFNNFDSANRLYQVYKNDPELQHAYMVKGEFLKTKCNIGLPHDRDYTAIKLDKES